MKSSFQTREIDQPPSPSRPTSSLFLSNPPPLEESCLQVFPPTHAFHSLLVGQGNALLLPVDKRMEKRGYRFFEFSSRRSKILNVDEKLDGKGYNNRQENEPRLIVSIQNSKMVTSNDYNFHPFPAFPEIPFELLSFVEHNFRKRILRNAS